jgi:membrane-associated phospholipid phosphatase
VSCFAVFLLLKNEEAYHKLCTVLAIGMTVFIVVSIIFPNIHLLRPETMPEENVFTHMISLLYLADTPTNLTPSIHVFNSLAIITAAWKWDWRSDEGYSYSNTVRGFWRIIISVLGILITLSTMLIKQHSFSDVVIAIALFFFTYILVYRLDFVFIGAKHVRRPAYRPRSARS